MPKTFEFDAGGFSTRYTLQNDGKTVKRTVLAAADGTEQWLPVNQEVSSWKWGTNGWTGQGSKSGAGYEVAKAFGFI